MILLENNTKKSLIDFILKFEEKKSSELAFVKKQIYSRNELDVFQYKSYYLLTYAYFEDFYRNLGRAIVNELIKTPLSNYEEVILKKFSNTQLKRKKLFITSNNVYMKIYDKQEFLNSHILKDLTSLDLLCNRKILLSGLNTTIDSSISKKLKNLKEIRNELTHEGNSKNCTEKEDYKKYLEDLISFFETFIEAILKWIKI